MALPNFTDWELKSRFSSFDNYPNLVLVIWSLFLNSQPQSCCFINIITCVGACMCVYIYIWSHVYLVNCTETLWVMCTLNNVKLMLKLKFKLKKFTYKQKLGNWAQFLNDCWILHCDKMLVHLDFNGWRILWWHGGSRPGIYTLRLS